jgi:protein TonB
MLRNAYWRKALVVSLLAHSLLLSGASWLVASDNAEPQEQYTDMELISDNTSKLQQANSSLEAATTATASNINTTTVAVKGQETSSPALHSDVAAVAAMASQPTAAASSGRNSDVIANTTTESSGDDMVAKSEPAAEPVPSRLLPPRILQRVNPTYPDAMRSQGQEGTTSIKLEVQTDGQPGNVWVNRSSGSPELDEAALEAVRNWRFVPAKDEATGTPMPCRTVVSVLFRLS